MNPGRCTLCGAEVEERCSGDCCRDCHKSITFEACIDDTWADEIYRQYGMTPPRLRGEEGSDAT